MNYERAYFGLMLKASARDTVEGYTERHHWYPKSIYPEYANAQWNLITLTAREHFIAHKLLTRILPESEPMKQAFAAMCHHNKGLRRLKISSKDFETSRQYLSDSCRERMAGKVGLAAHRKRVVNIYKDDVLFLEGVVMTEFERDYGVDHSNLAKTARGVRKHARGYRAEYVD